MCDFCGDVILTKQCVLDERYVLMWQQCACRVYGVWIKARVNVT